VCWAARVEPHRARARSQSSAAVSADGTRWFLLNASPDVRNQLSCLPTELPAGIRHVPVEAVLATDAELDHTLGIVLLREARALQLYLTHPVQSILEHDSRLVPVTQAFAEVTITELIPERTTALHYRDGTSSSLSVEPFSVPAGPPRFASTEDQGHTVGLLIHDAATGGSCAFVPGCGDLNDAILERLAKARLVLFDGTFWKDDELVALGIANRRAREMDHLPVSGPDGSLIQLARLAGPRVVYTHVNNTNPMLLEDSAERAAVERAGLVVGSDGMSFTV
jgi:pyrroloquinoline quinone biosynthesis protein B